LPNAAEDGVSVVATTPEPANEVVSGPACPSLVTTRLPFRVPVTLGENDTLMVQLLAAAIEVPHVFVWVKSPVTLIPILPRALVWSLLVSVTACAALAVPST